jgi:hypothetical protein
MDMYDASIETLTPAQQKKREATDALATMVRQRFAAAAAARVNNGVTNMMLMCRRAAHAQPLTGAHANPDFPVVYDLTTPITRGLVSLIRDTLTASASDLFTLRPTDDPELTPEAENTILGAMEQQQLAMLQLGISPEPTIVQGMVRQLLEAAKVQGREQARQAADALKAMVSDKLQVNGMDTAVREGVQDLVQSVLMVLKAPSPRLRKVKKWSNGRMVFANEVIRAVERIDPVNFYPAPNAVDPQSADYLIEVRVSTPNELAALSTVNGYDAEEIRRAMRSHPDGHSVRDEDTLAATLRETDSDTQITTDSTRSHMYHIVCHYGRVRGAYLKELGVEGVDDLLHYEAEVMTVGNVVIRAALNTDSAGRRPFFCTSYDPIPGSIWGRSPTSHLIPMQRAATSVFVSMLADMSLAGIHVEVEASRLHEDDRLDAKAIRPRVARMVKSSPTGAVKRAYDIFNVTAQTPTFQAQLDRLQERAYDVVGLSRMSLGQTAGAGTVGRTAGGIAAMLAQSSKSIKQVLRNMESDIIEPLVQTFVDYELEWGETRGDMHGDVHVQARGLTTVAEQVGQVDDLQWALQSVSSMLGVVDPATGKPYIPAAAPLRLLHAIFKAKGVPTSGVFPANFEATSTLQGGGTGGATLSGESPIELDGRSQVSIDAIANSSDITGAKSAIEG